MKNYIISINYKKNPSFIPQKFFIKLFNTNKNWNRIEVEKYNNEKIDFLYNIRINKFYDINCNIGNVFYPSHLKYLTNKYNLYKTIEKYSPETYDKYMVKHYEVDINNPDKNKDLFDNKKIFILRPTWGFERHGITIYKKYEDYENYFNTIGKKQYYNVIKRKNRNDNDEFKYDTYKYVLSEYIDNQLLFKNKIFDLRILNIISLVNKKYRSYLINPIVIHSAKKEKTENFNLDTAISTPFSKEDHFFNELENEIGLKNAEFILNQIKHVLLILLNIIKKNKVFENYKNINNTYEIFGLDFIVDNNYNVKLIEFNHKVGLVNYEYVVYRNLASCIINSTINKFYDKEYHIKIDKNIKKNIIRIHSSKKYL
jgi:hypothetical protein